MSTSNFHVAAMAGAGCGKTYSLVENYLCAVLGFDESLTKKRPQEILALTFTEKAASEMRLRITKRLQAIIADPYGDEDIVRLVQKTGQEVPDKNELQRVLRSLSTATIATFHSFCSQVLRREAVACGIDDRFSILSVKDELLIARNILRPLIIEEVEKDNRHVKSLVARMGLSTNMSSLGVLDGLMDVYLKLSEKNLTAEQVVALTAGSPVTKEELWSCFTEIESALMQFLSTKQSEKTMVRLKHVARLVPELFTALKADHEPSIARTVAKIRTAVQGNFGDRIARGRLVLAIATMGNRLVDAVMQDEEHAVAQLLVRFHHAFSRHKADVRVLSYADLLIKTKEILMDDVKLRQRVKLRIKHILVDEYQDTSPIQQDIIALLAEDRDVHKRFSKDEAAIDAVSFNGGPSLFMVGDKKQSIYGFRGASVELFDRMIKKMAETHAADNLFTKRLLVVNRRSRRRIIDLVNLVARHTMLTQGYHVDQALMPMSEVDEGRCGLWVLSDDQQLDKTKANCTSAVYGIVKLLSERGDISAKDIVVLTRRIKSAAIIKPLLNTFGIDARIIGGDGFFQQQEIADFICALKLINDPGHHLACGIVMRSPLVLLADHEIIECALLFEHGLTMEALSLRCQNGLFSDDSRRRFEVFQQALAEASQAIERDGLASALDVLLDRCDAAYTYGLHDDGEQKWANIEKLRTMFLGKAGNAYSAIDDFYDELFGQSKEPQAEAFSQENAVTIMTIHQSKGLEFKVVVMADGESAPINNFGDFLVNPSIGLAIRARGHAMAACAINDHDDVVKTRYERARIEQKTLEQEEGARLLYVALTRAREEVYVACSQASFVAQSSVPNLVGLFLQAYKKVPEEFLLYCDIDQLSMPSRSMQKCTSLLVQDNFAPVATPPKMQRWFASALRMGKDYGITSLIKKPRASIFRKVDGDGAHRLLAWICPLLRQDLSHDTLDYLVDAAMRSEGLCASVDTISAVKTTALALMARLDQHTRLISELPLSFMARPEIMIEGFADLVVIDNDFVGVIEFKSSFMSAVSESSYGQVLAYAEALAQYTAKRVRYAVVLVGSSPWEWQEYDDEARTVFYRSISMV